MDKIKIKLSTPESIAEFINVCSKYDYDINLYDGKNIIDAKSIVGVFTIAKGKIIEVKVITSDKNIISEFIEDIRKFEV